jgi:hypothetical protein
MWKYIVQAMVGLVFVISFSGCGSTEDTPKPPINPAGFYHLNFSNRVIGNALGACAVAPTNPDTVQINTVQNGYTWLEGNLTVNTGTLTCTSDNCRGTVSLNGMLNYYSYSFDVTITSNAMTGTLKQDGAACNDTYTINGQKQ